VPSEIVRIMESHNKLRERMCYLNGFLEKIMEFNDDKDFKTIKDIITIALIESNFELLVPEE